MYFWRIEKLKSEMAARPLSDGQALPYLVVFVALYAGLGYLPHISFNVWDVLGAVFSVALAVVGTIYVYRRNGGAAGQYFLQRYFALGWVVTVRWFVVLLPAILAFFGVLEGLGFTIRDETQWYEFAFMAIAEILVYWRIGHHVGDLSTRTETG
jgi:hypothetical protein